MSLEHPTPYESHLADQVEMVLREVEQFDSPGLAHSEVTRAKLDVVLAEYRQAISRGPVLMSDGHYAETAAPSRSIRVPGLDDDLPLSADIPFDEEDPDHLLGPIVIPAWNPRIPIVVRNGATVSTVLWARDLLRHTGLDMKHCTWHDGAARQGRYMDKPSLLTQTRGQYVVIWWVCPTCAERLQAAFPRETLGQLYDGHEPELSYVLSYEVKLASLGVGDDWQPYHGGGARGICMIPLGAGVKTPHLPE